MAGARPPRRRVVALPTTTTTTTQSKKAELAKEAAARGLDAEQAERLNVTAAVAERKAQTKKEYFEWNVYNDDSQYRAHQKRLASLPKATVPDDDASTAASGGASLAPGEALDPTAAGVVPGAVPVREAALNRLVDSLHAQALKRAKFHRHRTEVDEGDIDFISDANQVYNKKLARAFDKYTGA